MHHPPDMNSHRCSGVVRMLHYRVLLMYGGTVMHVQCEQDWADHTALVCWALVLTANVE